VLKGSFLSSRIPLLAKMLRAISCSLGSNKKKERTSILLNPLKLPDTLKKFSTILQVDCLTPEKISEVLHGAKEFTENSMTPANFPQKKTIELKNWSLLSSKNIFFP